MKKINKYLFLFSNLCFLLLSSLPNMNKIEHKHLNKVNKTFISKLKDKKQEENG